MGAANRFSGILGRAEDAQLLRKENPFRPAPGQNLKISRMPAFHVYSNLVCSTAAFNISRERNNIFSRRLFGTYSLSINNDAFIRLHIFQSFSAFISDVGVSHSYGSLFNLLLGALCDCLSGSSFVFCCISALWLPAGTRPCLIVN